MATKYKEEVGKFSVNFNTLEEWEPYFQSAGMVQYLKETYGDTLPELFEIQIKGFQFFVKLWPIKKNIDMDWHFYSGLQKITKADITAEPNAEKRRLLMSEFGIAEFFEDSKVIDEDQRYGTLIEATINGGTSKWIRWKNGTPERDPESIKYLSERKMLTEDGYKLYFEPVRNHHTNVISATAEAWDVSENLLRSADGYYIET